MNRYALGLYLLACLILGPHTQAASLHILAEAPLAATKVGYDPTSRTFALRVVTMGITVPADRSSAEIDAFASCASNAAWSVATEIRTELGLERDEHDEPDPSKPQALSTAAEAVARRGEVTAASYNAELNQRAEAIGLIVIGKLPALKQRLATTCSGKTASALPLITMAFNVRACMAPDSSGLCSEFKFDVPHGTSPTVGFTPSQFDKLYGWMTVTQPRPINEWFRPVDANHFDTIAAAGEMAWPDPPTPEVVLAQLEPYIERLRKAKGKIEYLSYLAPMMLNLARDNLAHIVDVVDHPFAAALLVKASGGLILSNISDEIARVRILDCARLHGRLREQDSKSTALDGVIKVANCAGVDFADDSVYIECLNGGHCLPKRTETAVAALMSITNVRDVANIALDTQLPRVGRAVQSFDRYEDIATACGKRGAKWEAMNCVLQATMTPNDYAAVSCIHDGAHLTKNNSVILDCATELLPASDRARIDCFRKYSNTPSSAIGCTALGDSSPQVQKAFHCMDALSGSPSDKVIQQCAPVIGMSDREIEAVRCVAEAANGRDRLLCIAKAGVPLEVTEQVAPVIACANASDDWKKYAACAATAHVHLRGRLGEAVSCGISNGGVNLGTAVCMANLDSHLTQDQAIVLQCAASSPDLTTFAVCAGGQMAVNLLVACRSQHFGDDTCFGKNNEIRRFMRALGIEKLVTRGSPIARMMDVEIKIIWFEYSVAEKTIKELSNFAKDVGHTFEKLGQSVGNAAEDFRKSAKHTLQKLCHC